MKLAIIVPFFNEEKTCAHFHKTLVKQLELLKIDFTLIYIDDGSLDGTLNVLYSIQNNIPNTIVLPLTRNFGHQAALTAGLDYAATLDFDAAITLDSDLQHPPQLIGELIKHYQEGFEIVYAVRNSTEKLGLPSKIVSSLFYYVLERISYSKMVHKSADFRLISKEALITLSQMRERHRYLRGLIPWMGYSYAVVSYDQPKRFGGKPSYKLQQRIELALHAFFSFSIIPLNLIAWLGWIMLMPSFFYLVYILIISISGKAVPGWSSLVSALLVLGGIQLLALGVIAQYTGMIFEQVKERPIYIIKKEDKIRFKKVINETGSK